MLLFPLAALLGVLAGIAAGGRVSGLTGLRLRLPIVVAVALAVQALLTLRAVADLPRAVHVGLLAATYAAAGGWLLLNIGGRSRPVAAGLSLAGVGWLLNTCVVLANGGMPVSRAALARIGARPGLMDGGGPLAKHVHLVSGAALAFLGDTIPVPPLESVVSIGDLVMIVGIVVLVAAAMLDPSQAPAVTVAGGA